MKQIEKTAYHEAGHVVAALAHRIRFKYVTIVPNTKEGYLGLVKTSRRFSFEELYSMSVDRLESHMIFSLAGAAAEQLFAGRANHRGANGDYNSVTELLLRNSGSTEIANAHSKYLWLKTKAFVNKPFQRSLIEAIAKGLLEHKTLTEDQVFEIRQTLMSENAKKVKSVVFLP